MASVCILPSPRCSQFCTQYVKLQAKLSTCSVGCTSGVACPVYVRRELIMTESKVLWQVICVFLMIHSTTAQEVFVMCFMPGSGAMCSGEGNNVTYADCCTGDTPSNTPSNTMYRIGNGVCTTCGPVVDQSNIIIAFEFRVGSLQTVVLQWALADGSLPAAEFRITNQEGNGIALPSFGAITTTSVQILNLRAGLDYTFRITALSDSGVRSPPASLVWSAGDSTLPRFVNFTVIDTGASSVTASWILESPGVAAAGQVRFLEEMTVRWVQATESLVITSANLVSLDPDSLEFPVGNNETLFFDSADPPTSGMLFNETFDELEADSRYIVRIDGVNSFGTSTTFFAFDTIGTSTIIILELGSAATATTMSLSLLLLATTAALVIKNLLL